MSMTPDRVGHLGNPGWSRLSPEQCERIHHASLQILARTGVRLFEPAAVDLIREAGATVSDGNLVRIPAGLVEQALSTAPKSVSLYDRAGNLAMPVGGHRTFFGPGSDCLNVIDHRTGERRKPVLQDVVEGVTVCDALANIDFVMSMMMPSDVDQRIADRYQMEVMLNHTTKPIVIVTYEMSGLVDAIEMAEAAAGGPDALREKPFAACYINVTTGLLHNADALQKLMFLADKGLPALYIPVGSGGMTGPVTTAGNVALTNAGTLVGLVLSQLTRQGAPVIVPGFGGDALDMRTMVDPYAEPDHRGVAESMAHYYGLPMFSLAGASDAKLVDQQAALEAALTLMVDVLSGGNIIHDLGYLESGLCFSLAQLIICDEIAAWLKTFAREVEVTDDMLALDLIETLGPEGSFLDTDHTRKHYRERWYPDLIERFNHTAWLRRGGKTLAERAADKVENILTSHKPQLLNAEMSHAVRAIVERAEKRLGIGD